MTEHQHIKREDLTPAAAPAEQTSTTEHERILQNNIIGQKTTAEGTAGKDGAHAPTGDAAREDAKGAGISPLGFLPDARHTKGRGPVNTHRPPPFSRG